MSELISRGPKERAPAQPRPGLSALVVVDERLCSNERRERRCTIIYIVSARWLLAVPT